MDYRVLMKALLLDDTHPFLEADLASGGLELIRDFTTPLEEFPSSHFEVDVLIIRSRLPVNAGFLARFPRLRVIGRLGAGLENIDLAAAEARGITCLRVPEGNARAVAEHALAMLLSLLNHLPRAQREVREGLWIREANKGRELQALTVGIVGHGVMGSAFANLLDAMGVKVLAYDKYKTGFASGGVEEVSWEQLQARADVVSLHLPLTAETRGLVDADWLAGFARPIHLLNTARGPIVRSADLVDALAQGRVLSAGLDTLEYEKANFTSLFDGDMPEALAALLALENVIITPHIAGWTQESFEKMGRGLAAKVLEAVKAV